MKKLLLITLTVLGFSQAVQADFLIRNNTPFPVIVTDGNSRQLFKGYEQRPMHAGGTTHGTAFHVLFSTGKITRDAINKVLNSQQQSTQAPSSRKLNPQQVSKVLDYLMKINPQVPHSYGTKHGNVIYTFKYSQAPGDAVSNNQSVSSKCVVTVTANH